MRKQRWSWRLKNRGITREEFYRQAELGNRWCSGHKSFVSATAFTARGSICRECQKKYHAEYWKRNIDRNRARCREFYWKDPERWRKYVTDKWAATAKAERQEKSFRWRLSGRFGISPADYDALLERQGGGCAICGSKRNGLRLPVDHDHSCCPGRKSCGKCIRGILCVRCNTIIGFLEKNSELVPLCEAYIREHRPSSTS